MKFEELYRARTDALDVPELDADELKKSGGECRRCTSRCPSAASNADSK
ncbi:MAG: hypothetical protein ACLUFM_00940 [Lachnospiraceae bacterium]